jgi:hypothetical protein
MNKGVGVHQEVISNCSRRECGLRDILSNRTVHTLEVESAPE